MKTHQNIKSVAHINAIICYAETLLGIGLRIAARSGAWVYYLGGLAEGQTPYDMLKPVVNAISGFSLGFAQK